MIREMLKTRLEELKDLPKQQRITCSDLAKILHKKLGDKSVENYKARISAYKNGGPELTFAELHEICKNIYDDADEVFATWCIHMERYENIFCALEYASSHRKFEIGYNNLSRINEIHTKSQEVYFLKEAAALYNLVYAFQRETESLFTLKQDFMKFKATKSETNALTQITLCAIDLFRNNFSDFDHRIKIIRADLKRIKNKFIRTSYKVRLFELLSQLYLYTKNDKKRARRYANIVIQKNIGPIFNAYAYNLIGMSYLYEDGQKAIYYVNKYLQFLRDEGRYERAQIEKDTTEAFIRIYWGLFDESFHTNDISEQAHYEIKWGDLQKGLKLIDEAIEVCGESPYKLYYKGMGLGDASILLRAAAQFLLRHNIFHCKLVHDELRKRFPEASSVLDTMMNEFTLRGI